MLMDFDDERRLVPATSTSTMHIKYPTHRLTFFLDVHGRSLDHLNDPLRARAQL